MTLAVEISAEVTLEVDMEAVVMVVEALEAVDSEVDMEAVVAADSTEVAAHMVVAAAAVDSMVDQAVFMELHPAAVVMMAVSAVVPAVSMVLHPAAVVMKAGLAVDQADFTELHPAVVMRVASAVVPADSMELLQAMVGAEDLAVGRISEGLEVVVTPVAVVEVDVEAILSSQDHPVVEANLEVDSTVLLLKGDTAQSHPLVDVELDTMVAVPEVVGVAMVLVMMEILIFKSKLSF